MLKRLLLVLTLGVLLTVFVPACGTDGGGETDPDTAETTDADVAETDVPVTCDADTPCDAGFECTDGACVAIPDYCDADKPCEEGFECSDANLCVEIPPVDCNDEAAGFCDDKCEGLTACETCDCGTDGACAANAIPDCCVDDDDCDDGFECGDDNLCFDPGVNCNDEGASFCDDQCGTLTACETCDCGTNGDCAMNTIADCCVDDDGCEDGFFCNDENVCEELGVPCSDAVDPDAICAGTCGTLSYCESCACNMDTDACEKIQDTGDACCVTAADCDDDNLATIDTCEQPGEPCLHVFDPGVCLLGVDKIYYHADFDQGSLSLLEIAYDNDPDDSVGWQIDPTDSVNGAYSLYFGDVACHTYYTGALTDECLPLDDLQQDAGTVEGHIRTIDITLGGSEDEDACVYALTFWAKFEGEETWEGLETATPDQLRIFVQEDVPTEIFASAIQTDKNSTDGEWVQFAADLTAWWGKTIRISFEFDSNDKVNNFYFGVMLDDIIVRSVPGAGQCAQNSDCPDDGKKCTEDDCTFFVNGAQDTGLCGYFKPDDDCDDCTEDSDCNTGGDCAAGVCVQEICEYQLDVACCETNLVQIVKKWDYEAGLGGWEVTDASHTDVTWTPVATHGAEDSGALYFGDKNKACPNDASAICPSYDNGDAVSAMVKSEQIVLQDDAAYRMLTFDLWMSTEWDGTPLNEFSNPINADRLTLYVEASGTLTEVWTSDMTGGSTYELDEFGLVAIGWESIGVDVSAFKGKAVRFVFGFDSGEYLENAHEGVYLDNISLLVACAPPCTTTQDCFDNLPCTDETCVAGICDYDMIGTCCDTADDCSDSNDCTIDLCQGGMCSWKYSTDPSCCTEGLIDSTTYAFEGEELAAGLSIAVAEDSKVTWQLAARPKGEGQALWFGNETTGTYQNLQDTGTEAPAVGSITFPDVTLPAGGVPVLEFDLYLETEWAGGGASWEFPAADVSFDKLSVFVNNQLVWDSFVYEIAGSTCGTGGCDFVPVRISLDGFGGQTASVRIAFDSLEVGPGFDGNGDNTFAGAFIDDLRIFWYCTVLDCYNSKECSDEPEPGAGAGAADDTCSKDKCLDNQCFFEATGNQGCCYPQDKASEGFEGGTSAVDLAGQSGDVTWQVLASADGARTHSGDKSLYFGNPANMTYDGNGSAVGNDVSWSLAIDPEPNLKLEWYQWLGLDSADKDVATADQFRVYLVDLANFSEQIELFYNKPTYQYYQTWRRVEFDLTAYAGKQVIVFFDFQSGDVDNNNGEGVYLDDLRIYKGCE